MTLRFLTSGESHGPAVVAILEGLPAGIPLTESVINHHLSRRQQGFGSGDRMKIEKDQAEILSGVMQSQTIGSPVALLIRNRDHEKWVNRPIKAYTAPRPGHADLTAVVKYGYNDIRPSLERASARETSARVAVGSICRQFLSLFNIKIGGYITDMGSISVNVDQMTIADRIEKAEQSPVRCPDPQASDAMQALITHIIEEKDTLGGIVEIAVTGLPVGLGSHVHWDRRLDSRLGAAVLGVQAIKGVEIGPAFENAHRRGTQVHDPLMLANGKITRPSNRAGGLEGGITNGEPLILRAAMKPIATTLTPQPTIDLANGEPAQTTYERSDYCPVPRAVPVLESVVAYVIADALLEKLGGDSISEMLPRYQALRQATLADVQLDPQDKVFWEGAEKP